MFLNHLRRIPHLFSRQNSEGWRRPSRRWARRVRKPRSLLPKPPGEDRRCVAPLDRIARWPRCRAPASPGRSPQDRRARRDALAAGKSSAHRSCPADPPRSAAASRPLLVPSPGSGKQRQRLHAQKRSALPHTTPPGSPPFHGGVAQKKAIAGGETSWRIQLPSKTGFSFATKAL